MRLSAPVYHLKRRARKLARDHDISLHEALDRIARQEGFARWSLLAAGVNRAAAGALLPRFAQGDLVLLGARPGHGKTLQGLRVLLEAAEVGREAVFYTLELTETEVRHRLHRLGRAGADGAQIRIETSDDISAAFICADLATAARGTVAVVDYLQILDQDRHKPPLAEQLRTLRNFAQLRGLILIFISQIDRSFAPGPTALPGLADIRRPNPVPNVFSKACFLHDGMLRIETVADL
ncbi:MAG: DNA helicase [Rhodobacteraceae bacterium]|nr:MAG: DNA helicase [Paracoccaceae bacterium]